MGIPAPISTPCLCAGYGDDCHLPVHPDDSSQTNPHSHVRAVTRIMALNAASNLKSESKDPNHPQPRIKIQLRHHQPISPISPHMFGDHEHLHKADRPRPLSRSLCVIRTRGVASIREELPDFELRHPVEVSTAVKVPLPPNINQPHLRLERTPSKAAEAMCCCSSLALSSSLKTHRRVCQMSETRPNQRKITRSIHAEHEKAWIEQSGKWQGSQKIDTSKLSCETRWFAIFSPPQSNVQHGMTRTSSIL